MGRGETNAKKRKRQSEAKAASETVPLVIETPKFKVVHPQQRGRDWTVSVALPGSTVLEAQSQEQKAWIASQVSRALGVFCVDEVVVYDDGTTNSSQIEENGASTNGGTSLDDPNQFLVHLLSYLEIPTQLRQYLFLPNAEPAAAKNLPNLELPHHLKSDEWCIYQEGVTLPGADEYGTLVEIGQRRPVAVKAQIPANTRVTLKFQEGADVAYHAKRDEHVLAEPVNPDEPREEAGLYWGYKVRRAGGLSQVFTECEYEDGYDISIGTSDSGASIETIYSGDEEQKISRFKHLMVVFGGPEGLEAAVRNDSDFQKLDVNNAKDIFDRWINICPGQGSRTIRTEEAMWIGLAGLQRLVARNASD